MSMLAALFLVLYAHSVAATPYLRPQSTLDSQIKHEASTDSQSPHIILIVADDLGYNDVSFHGSDQIPTPNIDFLAYNGVIFNNYYMSSICTPTRASLLTGRYPIHTGMQHSCIIGAEPYGLPLTEKLLPQYLNQLGYRSHLVGKWHLGMFKWDYTPLYRGFETHFGFWQGKEDYIDHTYEAPEDYWGLDFRRGRELLRNETGYYSTFLFRDEAVNLIDNHNKSEPLFLYLTFQAVHTGNQNGSPLQAPDEYIKKFDYIQNKDRRTFAGMVSALDDAVGGVYDALKENNMLDNSIIVFTTDNGGPANGVDLNVANNFPLRGAKYSLWEGGLRAVGLIHSPLLKRQGYVSNKLFHVSDWLPTLVSAVGGDHLLNFTLLDGVDAWDMLSEDGDAVRSELLHNIDPVLNNSAIRVGDYKLIVGKADKNNRNDWYPPYQLVGDGEALHYSAIDNEAKSSTSGFSVGEKSLRENIAAVYKSQWPDSVFKRIESLYSYAGKSDMYTGPFSNPDALLSLTSKQRRINLTEIGHNSGIDSVNKTGGLILSREVPGHVVKLDCGPKPSDAHTNCQPDMSPCLYHIPTDPCEYNNIAAWNPIRVSDMLDRLSLYYTTMVPVEKKPSDPAGHPDLHGGAWWPWR